MTRIRIVAEDGGVWEGDGDNLALAVRDVGRRHQAGELASEETRWGLTAQGAAVVRQLHAEEVGGALTPERQLRNVAEYLLRARADLREETGEFLAELVLLHLDGRLPTIPAAEAKEPF